MPVKYNKRYNKIKINYKPLKNVNSCIFLKDRFETLKNTFKLLEDGLN